MGLQMKKLLLIILSIFCIAEASEPLVVGTASGYAPFVSLNDQGEYEGFDVDVAKELAERLNRKLVLKDLGSMPSLLLSLKQNKVDALIWAISITEERMKVFDMVYYQGDKVESLPLMFWKTAPVGIREIGDLKKCPQEICVEAGSYQESVLKESVKLKYLDTITAVVMDIKAGNSSAAAIDPSLVAKFKERYPEIQVVNLPLPPNQQSMGNGICLNRSNEALTAQVRQAIEAMRKEGKIAELEAKWRLR
jgi:ABC-type amino acid transport substrate-binding protein